MQYQTLNDEKSDLKTSEFIKINVINWTFKRTKSAKESSLGRLF